MLTTIEFIQDENCIICTIEIDPVNHHFAIGEGETMIEAARDALTAWEKGGFHKIKNPSPTADVCAVAAKS